MCSGLLPLVTVLVSFAGSPLREPSLDEVHFFAEGMRLYNAGDAAGAERAWRAGYDIAHDPAFLVHVGEAEEKEGRPGAAAETYRRYLREAPDAADRTEIEQRIARIAPPLQQAPPATAPAPAPEANEIPGELGAGAAAARPTPPAPPAKAPGATAAPGAPAAGGARTADQEIPQEELEGWNTLRGTAWIATAVAVAALGTAGFFAASASSKKDDVNRLTSFRDDMTGAPLEYATIASQYETAVRDGQRYDRNAKIALGVSVATAVFATSLFIVDSVRAPESRLVLAPALSPPSGGARAAAGAALTWTF
jgi:hypothetical protein